MPLQLAEVQEDDCTAFAIVDEAAGADWPLKRAMEQGKASPREMFEQWFQGVWGTDPTLKWMKVVDSETGEMAAGALWRFVLEPAAPKTNAEEEAKKQAGDVKDIPPVFIEMGRRWKEFHAEFIGDQPFANLQVLVTHPKFQRMGAGSMLVKYGCDVADEKGILCAVGASDAGYPLYARHGFEVKTTRDHDLRPYGVDAIEQGRSMIRPAKGKK